MNRNHSKLTSECRAMSTLAHLKQLYKTSSGFALALCIAISATPAQAEVSQAPLLLGGGNVPGNLALVPSVEWPTILSTANLGDYSSNITYTGYFDSGKCYRYNHNAISPSESHFYPASLTANRTCTNAWSGNFLNWAATQTIDPFRSALTGGYRVKDTTTETWLEKANHTGQNTAGIRVIPASGENLALVQGATPADWTSLSTRLHGLKNRMFFAKSVTTTISDTTVASVAGDTDSTNTVLSGTPATTATTTRITVKNGNTRTLVTQCTNCASQLPSNFSGATPYTQGDELDDDTVYEVYIRVKVCDSSVGIETNCKKYGSNYKPEGLIQQYSSDIRYSVFGYLNDSTTTRDGGVLRAQQKYVGPTMRSVGSPASQSNPAKEWDESTGVFIQNPNPTDATSSSVQDSGVINYLNKFGQMTSSNHKSYDPVSELYYTALRYLKNQGNVSTYSNRTGNTLNQYQLADGFPVITNWADPIQYACQKNVILGIGDVNTHRDKNLPGNSNIDEEPTVPQEVTDDTTINVVTATQKVATLEGITINTPFNVGRKSSAYMVGLAYDANTKDQRPLVSGKQTFSTHWVDVRENGVLAQQNANQYWLAAKYGGFKVPANFGDPYARVDPLEEAWWRTTTDWLDSPTNTYKRPDNFYVASDATKMVESLKKAFANIANEVQSTTASLATNSTRLGTDTAIFQSLLDSRRWSGDLLAKKVAANGVVASAASWSAADQLDALTSSEIGVRKIFTNTPPTQALANGPFISTTGSNFNWAGLNSAQRALLGKSGEANTSLAESRLSFLRGDRSNEISIDNQSNPFRQRSSRMGDIVNSDPQLIHKQDFGYARLSWNDGAVGEAYTTFRQSSAYQARKPLIVVGANDGMLHGFDASINDTPNLNGGKELFAYVPDSVISNLTALTEPNYSHRYYVDGTPRVSDAWLGDATGWKTMVVGSTGAGGKSIFALDITNPGSMTSSNVMWEFRHPKMGYTIGQPALVALPNGKFAVIVSSGYHDTATTDGRIWILDAADGSIINEFTLATTGSLGAPLAADTDYDLAADRIYVGDTLGNLWRVDLSKHNNGSLIVQIPNSLGNDPLFIAKDAAGNRQAITAPLSSAFNDKKEHMVYFGTGSFYRNGDNEVPATPKTDTFYGIIDGGVLIDGRSSLLQQQILKEVSLADGKTGRAVTQNTLSDTQKGWYMDLAWSVSNGGPGPKGERVVARATLRNDRVIFTTLTPAADPCAFGGSSFIMSVSRASGARLNYGYFDSDGDGDIDSDDTASLDNGGGNVPLSGLSDPDDGVTKGVASLYKWLCFAGSSGAAPTCIPVSGSHTDGRKSWREVRSN